MAETVEATSPIKVEPSSPSNVPIKRKASPSPSPEASASKRARTDHDSHDDAHHSDGEFPRGPSARDRRDSHHESERQRPPASREEEKKRSKRLFGGLLSTLNQSKTGTQQLKRRREIEQRQQEKAQQQQVEDNKRLSERLDRLYSVRRAEQGKFDEKVMKMRHSNMLARAHSLQTRAEPRIYYRPWKLSAEQEDIIDDQIAEAKARIARESGDFPRRRQGHEGHFGPRRRSPRGPRRREFEPRRDAEPVVRRRSPTPDAPTAARAPSAEMPDATPGSPGSAKSSKSPRRGSGSNSRQALDKDHDEPGDVMVDNEEDMVMY